MTVDTGPVLAWIEAHFDDSVKRLEEFLRIPSVGADPAHDADTRRAAEWLTGELRGIGIEAALHETPGHPMVVGRSEEGRGPRILYYGHYDVQPPDPLELWESPPFEPVVVEGPHGPRIIARGAVDDKGQLLTILEALRAWKAVHGALPVPVTLLVEGEEESSSPNLDPFLERHRQALAADVVVVSDTLMPAIDQPAITTQLRGLLYAEVTVGGPARDLHSGMFGGAVVNPVHVLARLIAGLHDAHGRVTVEGFYDRVLPLSPEQRRSWQELGLDERAILAAAGVERSVGEEGWSVIERIWARPCLDVNGIRGGYTGEGAKTVIPAEAHAKLSCRLVPEQRPEEIFAALERHFRARLPEGCRLSIRELGRGDPVRVPTDSPHLGAARRALGEVFGREPALIGCGGSIPVVASFERILGLDTILVGFGLDDDRMHGPNEKFELACLRNGIKSHALLLARMAELAAG